MRPSSRSASSTPERGGPMADPGATETAQRPSLAFSTLTTLGTSLAVAVLSLVNVLIIARALGPVGRGDVAFLTTIAYLVSQLALCGVEQANVNIASSDRTATRALATNSALLALAFGALAVAAVAGLIAIFPSVGGQVDAGLRWLTLAIVPMLIFQSYVLLLVRAHYAFHIANAAYLIVPALNVIVNSAFLAFGLMSVGSALVTWIAGQAVATLLMAGYLRVRLAAFGPPDAALARSAVGFGLKAHGGRIMMLGNYRADQWLVGAMAGSRELGLYSVAVAWAEALFYLPTAIASVHRPDLVRSSSDEAAVQTARVFRVAVLVTIPAAAAMAATAPLLCVVAFGEDFRGAVDDLRVLTAGSVGIVALKLLGNALTAQRKPVLETAAIATAFVATTVLDVALIPRHGGLGAAIASSAAYALGGMAVALLFVRAFHTRLWDLVPRPRDVVALRRLVRTASLRARPSPSSH
jgi:O-antigen/teichoic acid export membrane protein